MHDHRGQELISSAIGHLRRARRNTGRLVISGLGFGVAYYLDAANGAARREHLLRSVRRTVATIDSVWAPEAGDPPPVFTPILRGLGAEGEPRPARRHQAS